jgi:hypothetical protein
VEDRGMSVEAILSRIKGVRRSGPGWLAKCPAHSDRGPSLSIGENNGKILLHCFAGCTPDAVCAAIGIKISDLFTDPGTAQSKPRVVREAEKQISDLRSRLTPRERVLPVTVIYCDAENLDAGLARALALAVEGELVQCALEGCA